MKVVNLTQGQLAQKWDKMRSGILQGDLTGFFIGVRASNGAETVYLGGHYQSHHEDVARIAMRASWERTKADDVHEAGGEPPGLLREG